MRLIIAESAAAIAGRLIEMDFVNAWYAEQEAIQAARCGRGRRARG